MIRKKIILVNAIICASLVVGCSDYNENNIDKMLESEYQGVSGIPEWDGIEYENTYDMAETTDGIYCYDSHTFKVTYYDKETGTKTLLCAQPECKHNTSNCEAYYYRGSCCDISDGYLYFDEMQDDETYALIRCDLSGANRTEIVSNIYKKIEQIIEEYESKGICQFQTHHKFVIINGELYVFCSVSVESNGFKKSHIYLDKYSIDTGECIETIFEKEMDAVRGVFLQDIYQYQGKIYIMIWVSGEQNETYKYFRIDDNTSNAETIENRNLRWAQMYEDKLLFQGNLNKDNIYMMDWSGNIEILPIELTDEQIENNVYFHRAGEYLFMRTAYNEYAEGNDYSMKIYDKELNYLDTIHFNEVTYVWGGNTQIIFKNSTNRFYYIDPAQIGSGNIEVKEYIEK